MHGIEWERNISQEFADLRRSLVGRFARSTNPYQNWEDEEDTNSLEQSIQTDRSVAFDVRHTEEKEQDNRTDPECASYLHWPEMA